MEVTPTSSPACLLLKPRYLLDARGYFVTGLTTEFVQDSYALSLRRGAVRGSHLQVPLRMHGQARAGASAQGSIYDVNRRPARQPDPIFVLQSLR